jgi:hypothetical protein
VSEVAIELLVGSPSTARSEGALLLSELLFSLFREFNGLLLLVHNKHFSFFPFST